MGPIAFATNSETLTSGKIAQLGGQQESKGGGWVNSSLRCYSLKVSVRTVVAATLSYCASMNRDSPLNHTYVPILSESVYSAMH